MEMETRKYTQRDRRKHTHSPREITFMKFDAPMPTNARIEKNVDKSPD